MKLVIIGDPDAINRHWRTPTHAGGQWAVDYRDRLIDEKGKALTPSTFEGVLAPAWFAAREKQVPGHRPVQLPDGSWRVLVPNNREAKILADRDRSHAYRNEINVTIEEHPLEATSHLARDATRAHGWGELENGFVAVDLDRVPPSAIPLILGGSSEEQILHMIKTREVARLGPPPVPPLPSASAS